MYCIVYCRICQKKTTESLSLFLSRSTISFSVNIREADSTIEKMRADQDNIWGLVDKVREELKEQKRGLLSLRRILFYRYRGCCCLNVKEWKTKESFGDVFIYSYVFFLRNVLPTT